MGDPFREQQASLHRGGAAEVGPCSDQDRAGPEKRCHLDLQEPDPRTRKTRSSQPRKVVAHSRDPIRPQLTEPPVPGGGAGEDPTDEGDGQSTRQQAEGSIQA